MKIVIPCAGRGERLGLDIPKILIPINGVPLLNYIVAPWAFPDDEFIFIVRYQKEEVIKHLPDKSRWVEQKELKGIAHAILQAEPYTDGKFVVALGDCLALGKFEEKEFEQGIGVWIDCPWDEVKKSYTVDIKGELVKGVYEKSLQGGYCGMGVYFFDKRVFGYIRETPPSKLRNEVEITDVIQKMIDAGEKITPVWFEGNYINITYEEDIRKAERLV